MSQQDLEEIHGFINYLKYELEIDYITVNLVGGEPTLDLKEFERCFDQISRWDIPLEMTTNGSWLNTYAQAKQFSNIVWKELYDENMIIRISNSPYHLPFRKNEKKLITNNRIEDAFMTPDEYFQDYPQHRCPTCDLKLEAKYSEKEETKYNCKKCDYSITEEEYQEENDRLVMYDNSKFNILYDATVNHHIYIDTTINNPEKISPVGRAKKWGLQDGECHPVNDVKFTFMPGAKLYDPCCNGGHVPLGHASNPQDLFEQRFKFITYLHKAYPSENKSHNHYQGERCKNCPSMGTKFLKLNPNETTLNLTQTANSV
jgi:hypothetical protein